MLTHKVDSEHPISYSDQNQVDLVNTGLYWLWVPSISYSGYTCHQLDCQNDQGKWNWWVVSFAEWIKNSPIVSLSVSRTFNSEGNCHKPNSGFNQFEWDSQNDKEGKSGCFASKIIQMKTLLLGNNMHIMTQSLKRGDGPPLPPGLSVVNMHMKVISGSKWVAVVGIKLDSHPTYYCQGHSSHPDAVPPVEVTPNTLKKFDQIQGIQQTKMTVEQRKKLSFQQLDLSGLDHWSDRNQVGAWALLAEYHDIFSL